MDQLPKSVDGTSTNNIIDQNNHYLQSTNINFIEPINEVLLQMEKFLTEGYVKVRGNKQIERLYLLANDLGCESLKSCIQKEILRQKRAIYRNQRTKKMNIFHLQLRPKMQQSLGNLYQLCPSPKNTAINSSRTIADTEESRKVFSKKLGPIDENAQSLQDLDKGDFDPLEKDFRDCLDLIDALNKNGNVGLIKFKDRTYTMEKLQNLFPRLSVKIPIFPKPNLKCSAFNTSISGQDLPWPQKEKIINTQVSDNIQDDIANVSQSSLLAASVDHQKQTSEPKIKVYVTQKNPQIKLEPIDANESLNEEKKIEGIKTKISQDLSVKGNLQIVTYVLMSKSDDENTTKNDNFEKLYQEKVKECEGLKRKLRIFSKNINKQRKDSKVLIEKLAKIRALLFVTPSKKKSTETVIYSPSQNGCQKANRVNKTNGQQALENSQKTKICSNLNKIHKKDGLVCDVCQKSYSTAIYLARHRRLHSSLIKPYL